MKLAEMNKQQLTDLAAQLNKEYEAFKAKGLKLNMSRGKPSAKQLDLSMPMLEALHGAYKAEDGTDTRNYGGLDGIIDAKKLFAEIFELPVEQIIVGGNASLNLMYDTIARAYIQGVAPGATPWGKVAGGIKFLCPAPGYDRHFTVCEAFNIEMIPVPMTDNGPDMDVVEKLVAADDKIKGIWCVPMYSNPDGITYDDATVKRLAAMKTAAPDFRIFWDNAYCLHHLDHSDRDHLYNVYTACKDAGNEDRVYIFTSTSKITFPNGGICAMAASPANISFTKKQLNAQIISYNKVNQLMHTKFLPNLAAVEDHMKKHAAIMKPKFDIVLAALEKELAPLDCARWAKPKGGYFVSLFTMDGCAKRTVQLCKDGGVELTGAGATYPYGKDPQNSNIRIAPSFPPEEELKQAMELFCIAVKIASVEKLLA